MSDTTAPHKALDLDELFGEARAIKVIHDGKEYELLRLEGINPKGLSQFQRLQKKSAALQKLGSEMTDKQSADIDALLDEMILILCKDMPVKTLPFIKKMRIVTWYIEETQGKKGLETVLEKATGARRSRG